jgi:hypothetical protein
VDIQVSTYGGNSVTGTTDQFTYQGTGPGTNFDPSRRHDNPPDLPMPPQTPDQAASLPETASGVLVGVYPPTGTVATVFDAGVVPVEQSSVLTSEPAGWSGLVHDLTGGTLGAASTPGIVPSTDTSAVPIIANGVAWTSAGSTGEGVKDAAPVAAVGGGMDQTVVPVAELSTAGVAAWQGDRPTVNAEGMAADLLTLDGYFTNFPVEA